MMMMYNNIIHSQLVLAICIQICLISVVVFCSVVVAVVEANTLVR